MSATTPIEIFIAVFPNQATANGMIDSLKQAQKSGAIELVDAAKVTKNEKGQIHTDELRELTVKQGAIRGAAVGAVLGIIFPPSLLVGALAGGAAGGLIGKLRDTGVKTEDLEKLAAEIEPGEVAVLALVEDRWVDQLVAAAQGYEHMSRHAFDARAAAVLVADPVTGVVGGAGYSTGENEIRAGAFVAGPAGTPATSTPSVGEVAPAETESSASSEQDSSTQAN